MNFVKPSTILSGLIAEYLFMVPVVNRFGIRLGTGEKTIAEICTQYAINEDFFLAIVNTYLNEDFFPERKLQAFDVSLVADYLQKTYAHYQSYSLPNLEKHLNAFVAMSDAGNMQLKLIHKLFTEFKSAFDECTNIEKCMDEDDCCGELLLDMKNVLIKHISGSFNENLCYAVLFSVDSLQQDLAKNDRIKNKILKPMIKDLIDSGMHDWQSLLSARAHPPTNGAGNPISQREIEVLKLVALGCLNKEIADRLNISLNTVLSHRKNITSKLGIKTVSGLTFYCLSHGYISPDSIEI